MATTRVLEPFSFGHIPFSLRRLEFIRQHLSPHLPKWSPQQGATPQVEATAALLRFSYVDLEESLVTTP